MKFGIVADIHKKPNNIIKAIEIFKNEKVDAIIVNGDIGEAFPDFNQSLTFTANILKPLGKSNIKTYIQPGSSETIGAFGSVLKKATEKYPNLISTIENPLQEKENHLLLFIPGSDSNDTGEYHLTTDHEQYVFEENSVEDVLDVLENIDDLFVADI